MRFLIRVISRLLSWAGIAGAGLGKNGAAPVKEKLPSQSFNKLNLKMEVAMIEDSIGIAAAQALALQPRDKGWTLAELLGDFERQSIGWIMSALKYYRGDAAALQDALRQGMQRKDVSRVRFAEISMRLGDHQGKQAFLSALKDPDHDVRQAAVEVLTWSPLDANRAHPDLQIRAEDIYELISSLLDQPCTPMGRAATHFCLDNFQPSFTDPIVRALDALSTSDEPEDAKVLLWFYYIDRHAEMLAPFARRLLQHVDIDIRMRAAVALMKRYDKEAILTTRVLLDPLGENAEERMQGRREDVQQALVDCAVKGDEEIGALASGTAREIIDTMLGNSDATHHFHTKLKAQGLSKLLAAALRHPVEDSASWVDDVARNPAIDEPARAAVLIQWMCLKASRSQEVENLGPRLQALMPYFNWISGTLIHGLREWPDVFLPAVLFILTETSFKFEAAFVLADFPMNPRSPEIAEALDLAWRRESDSMANSWLLEALTEHRDVDNEMLDQLDPKRAMFLYWRRERLDLVRAADLLLGAGAIKVFDRDWLMSKTFTSGNQIIDILFFADKNENGFECKIQDDNSILAPHDELFSGLVSLAKLDDRVSDISLVEAGEEFSGDATLRFVFDSKVYRIGFLGNEGGYMDVDVVVGAVNEILTTLNSDRRVFQLVPDHEYGRFCVAKLDEMQEVAQALRLPLLPMAQ